VSNASVLVPRFLESHWVHWCAPRARWKTTAHSRFRRMLLASPKYKNSS